jgi:hypothetical protein
LLLPDMAVKIERARPSRRRAVWQFAATLGHITHSHPRHGIALLVVKY